MGLTIFRASGNQKYVGIKHAVYATAHDAASGTELGYAAAILVKNDLGNRYAIYRGFVDFPSDLLGNDTVTGARLILRFSDKDEADAGYTTLHIVEGVQDIPVELSDYGDHLAKTTSGGSIAYADMGTGNSNLNIITLNATGLGWINPDGPTKFCLRLISDISSLVPTDEDNQVVIDWGGWIGVVTNDATSVLGTSATLNGTSRGGSESPPYLEITYVGDNLEYPRVRFNYGISPDYSNNTSWQSGIAFLDDFSAGVTGLTQDSYYMFRTEIEDAAGTFHGSFKYFSTPDPGIDAPTVITKPATLVSDVSAQLHGEVTDDGAESCEVRFRYAEVVQRDDFEWGSDGDPLSNDGGGINWTTIAAGTSKVEIETTSPYAGTRCARLYRDGTNVPTAYCTQAALTSGQVIEFQVKKDETSYFVMAHGDGTKRVYCLINASEDIQYYDGSYHSTGSSVVAGTWYSFSIRNIDWDAGTYDIYMNDNLIYADTPMHTTASDTNRLRFNNSLGTSSVHLDNVLVHKGWTLTDWQNSLNTDDTYHKDILGLTAETEYAFTTQGQNSGGEGLWASPLYFTTGVSGTRCFTIPDLFDDHGRVAKGAWVRAYRVDTFEIVGEGIIDEHGNATICGLPNDVDITFHVTWGGGG